VKFLLWQLSIYALAAAVVGCALGVVWVRSTTRLLRRHAEHLARSLDAAEVRIRRLTEERTRTSETLADAKQLGAKLLELHGVLALVEADVRANQLSRAEAERGRDEATASSDRYRAEAARVRQAEFDVSRLKSQLAEARATLADQRVEAQGSVAGAAAKTQRLEESLARLRRAHDAGVVAHQTALSGALIAGEEARALNLTLAAEVARLRATVPAVVTLGSVDNVIDLREHQSALGKPRANQ
jgi:cell division protein FtsL